jgi:peptide/nickel transport system substrate-binding protein
MTRFGLSVAIAALLVAPAGMAKAMARAEVGLSAEPSAMDPHFHNLRANNSMTKHIFDRIVDQDENQIVRPMLASSWKTLDETTWEFKLRPGVKFSDGSDFSRQ